MDNNHIISVGPDIIDAVIGIVKIFLAKEISNRIVMAGAVGGLTFGILELFMKPGLKFDYITSIMPSETSTKFKISILLIIVTVLPMVAAIAPIFVVGNNKAFITIMENIIIAATLSALLCWILSWALKRHIPKSKRKHNHFLLVEAINIVIGTTGDYIASWATKLIMTIVNLGIKIIHKPFVMEYGVIAIILNLVISFVLISIMGISKEAGAANILGSLIGGSAHYLIRRKKIIEIRANYMKMYNQRKKGKKA